MIPEIGPARAAIVERRVVPSSGGQNGPEPAEFGRGFGNKRVFAYNFRPTTDGFEMIHGLEEQPVKAPADAGPQQRGSLGEHFGQTVRNAIFGGHCQAGDKRVERARFAARAANLAQLNAARDAELAGRTAIAELTELA